MMDQIEIYIILFGIIVIIGQVFDKSPLPISLLLVISGMLLSLFPQFPRIELNPDLVLNVFLPLLIFQISAFSSWKDTKKEIRTIALMSVGHVLFITLLVAIVAHAIIPGISWPLACLLGSVISPPDDVAIVTIAEKIRMPERIVTVLEGEGLLNDATALTLFRFALVATLTSEFSTSQAIGSFFAIIIGEILYGFVVGNIIGALRLKIQNPRLHMIASLLTPFIAYFPAEMLGGSGILATAVTGFVIGHRFSTEFTPEYRLLSRSVWPTVTFTIQNLLFLLVGLNMESILESISSIPFQLLMFYSLSIIAVVIIGRFIWVYTFVAYLPRLLFPYIRKKDPELPWQYPFIVSWAGMRGAISLAAALAIPMLPTTVEGVNTRNFIIFLVFCVVTVTFILQGTPLPWILKITGLSKYGQREKYNEHIQELSARLFITKAALRWMRNYMQQIQDDPKLTDEIKLYIREYKMLKQHLSERIHDHDGVIEHDERTEALKDAFILSQITEVERSELMQLWKDDKINLTVRNKLIDKLDHRIKNISD